ncbi:MAG: hypothetical protein M0P31_10795 [Solirubrobacteraceae bacterium]|nr:hypothetical protein [Solirubrobacteraceae bacterium]
MSEKAGIRRLVTAVVGVVAVVVLAVVVTSGSDPTGHRLSATVTEATNVIAGQEVRAGGKVIGVVDDLEPIDRGHRAKVTLRITEDDAWPLPRGTKFSVRWGGTASFYNRYVRVERGEDGGPVLADGATIPAGDFTVPVEVDQLLADFDVRVRRDLKRFVDNMGPALARARGGLEETLEEAPPALEQGRIVIGELVADRGSLAETINRTDKVVDAVRRADPGLSSLLEGAARTFDAIADRSTELERTIQALPATFRQVRQTLPKADTTLQGVSKLAGEIRPGVRELRRIAAPVDRTLRAVQRVTPDARATLRTVRRDGDDINRFVTRLTTLSPQLSSTSDEAITALKCIRPWTPEIVSLLMTWGDFMSWNDGKDKILRAQIQHFLPAQFNSHPMKPAEVAKLYPGMTYGFPRPPGYNAGQPWFQPECGAGPDALDPSKDQEANAPIARPMPEMQTSRKKARR